MSLEKILRYFPVTVLSFSVLALIMGYGHFREYGVELVSAVLVFFIVCTIVYIAFVLVSRLDGWVFPILPLLIVVILTASVFACRLRFERQNYLRNEEGKNSFTGNEGNFDISVDEVKMEHERLVIFGRLLGGVDIGAYVTIPYGVEINQTDLCNITGQPVLPENSAEFNFKDYLNSKNIFFVFSNPKIECKPSPWVWGKLIGIKKRVRDKIEKVVPEPQSSLLIGILFGENLTFYPKFETAIRASGLSHVVAASGFNVSIVLSMVENMFFFLPAKPKKLISLPLIWIYAFLTGFASSMLRACAMTTCAILASTFDLGISSKTIFLTSVSIMILINPLIIFDIGFQLSVLATFGLMYLSPILEEIIRLKWIPYTTISCILTTLPVTLITFNTFATYTVIANALVLPIVEIVMLLGVVGIVISPVLYLAWGSLKYMEEVCLVISNFPFAQILVSQKVGVAISLFILLLIFSLILSYEKRNKHID